MQSGTGNLEQSAGSTWWAWGFPDITSNNSVNQVSTMARLWWSFLICLYCLRKAPPTSIPTLHPHLWSCGHLELHNSAEPSKPELGWGMVSAAPPSRPMTRPCGTRRKSSHSSWFLSEKFVLVFFNRLEFLEKFRFMVKLRGRVQRFPIYPHPHTQFPQLSASPTREVHVLQSVDLHWPLLSLSLL